MSEQNIPDVIGRSKLTADAAYRQALDHFIAGRFTEVEKICLDILRHTPNYIDAINLLGLIAQQFNRHDMAVKRFQHAINMDNNIALLYFNLGTSLFQLGRAHEVINAQTKAIELQPNYAEAYGSLGDAYKVLGQLDEAVIHLKKAISIKPDFADAYYNLGVTQQEQNKLDEAVSSYQKAISINPYDIDAFNNLGIVLKKQGKLDEAVNCYQKTIALNPGLAAAYSNLGIAQKEQGKQVEAVKSFKKALAIKPEYADAHNNLGVTFKEQGKLEEAVLSYKKALTIKPDYIEAYCNLGNALKVQGKLEEAVISYKKAIEIKPEYTEAHNNLGIVQQEQGKLEEAVKSYKKALEIKPEYVEAHCNLGTALKAQGKLEEAVISYHKALTINPDYAEAHYNVGKAYLEQGKHEKAVSSYQKAIAIKPDHLAAHNNLIYCTDLISDVKTNLFQVVRQNWNRQFAEHLQTSWQPFINRPDANKKLRIGYVGAFFRNHSAAHMFGPVILNHDLNKFEIYCYAGNKNEDNMTAKLKNKSTKWLQTCKLSDVELGEQIRYDGIDILVDLAGHMYGSRLLTYALKPAPIQVTAWGYPFGCGIKAIDYIFADPISIPQSDRHLYTEQVVDLPCVAHFNLDIPFPDIKSSPVSKNGYITFGAFNRIEKYTLDVYKLWSKLLLNIPSAKLLIKDTNLSHSNKISEIEEIFHAQGIPVKRLIFMGNTDHFEHLKAHDLIDIMLDPYPQTGGMTVLNSLRMGVPVLTCENKTRLRTSASLLHILGLDEWRAVNEDDYIDRAIRLAKDTKTLKALRQQLRKRFDESVIGNSTLYTASVEASYRHIWQKWCEKQNIL
ncbi:MAG: tetratricopeptide repeat protein [Magnetococcales bacterium]|nr:tetratricopeptide repeat protein [Magnetococcales bacterium]